MSRHSARKVKLTSKFEEFSTSRLASIQRQAQADSHQHASPDVAAAVAAATPEPTPVKPEKSTPARAEKEHPKVVETPKAADPVVNHHVSTRERATPYKTLRHKAPPITPITPAYEPVQQTLYSHMTPLPKLTANGKVRGRPRKCLQQKAETVVKPMSSTREELLRLREENANLRMQIEQKTADYEDLKRQSSYTGQTVPKVDYDDLKEKYQRDVNNAKRHEWCAVCLEPSRYYCCWNTTYCSQKCQVSDWYQRHIKSCERRKAFKSAS